MTTDRAQRFAALKREIAATTGLAVDHERVLHLAVLKIAHEQLTARLLAGETIQTTELLQITDKLAELTPVPEHKVVVEIVHGDIPHCPKCGWTRQDGRDEAEQKEREARAAAREKRAAASAVTCSD